MIKTLLLLVPALFAAMSSVAQTAEMAGTRFLSTPFSSTAQVARHAATRAADLSEGANTDIRIVNGNKQFVTVSGWGFVQTDQGLAATSFDRTSDVVYGDDGYVYLHSPLGGTASSYVRGELSADGRTVTVQYPQVISTVSAPDLFGTTRYYPVYAEVMECSIEEDELGVYSTYSPTADEELNRITYTIADDGSISMNPPLAEQFATDERGYIVSPQYILSEHVTVPAYVAGTGPGQSPETLWLGPGCINVSYNALPSDITEVVVPDNLDWDDTWVCRDSRGQTLPMKIAFDGNRVYIGGLSRQTNITSDVFVGLIFGNRVIFPNRQLLGYDNLNHELIYLMPARGRWEHSEQYDEDYLRYTFLNQDFEMGYDAAAQRIYNLEPSCALLVSASFTRTDYFFTALFEPEFACQNSQLLDASPMAPSVVDWNDYTQGYGVYQAAVRIPTTNVNGALLPTARVFYTFFVDDQPYYFPGDDNGFEADECLIPFDHNAHDIFNQDLYKSLYLHLDTPPYKVSVQSYYVSYSGATFASQMASLVVGTDGIGSADGNRIVSVRHFDLSGRLVGSPAPGQLLIEEQRMADGTILRKKTIIQ